MKRILFFLLLISSISVASVAQNSVPSAATAKTGKDTITLQEQIKVAPKAIDWYVLIDSADGSWERTKNYGQWNKKNKGYICRQHDKTNTCRDSLICQLEQQNKLLKDTLSMFTFFNNSTVSLFSDSTLIKNGMEKKLQGVYKEMYKTVRMVDKLNQDLLKISTIEANKKSQQKEKNWSNTELNQMIWLDIRNILSDVEKDINTLKKRDKSFFSNEQHKYYKQQIDKFDSILYKYL